jgi:hypothetical protein
VTVRTCEVFVATKENHTSSSAPVPAHAVEDCVAPTLLAVVVDVHVDVPFTVTDVAFEQSLFVGGLVFAVDATQELVNPPQLLCTYKVYDVCCVKPFAVADVVPAATEPEDTRPVDPLPPAPDDLSSQLYPLDGGEPGAVQERFAVDDEVYDIVGNVGPTQDCTVQININPVEGTQPLRNLTV